MADRERRAAYFFGQGEARVEVILPVDDGPDFSPENEGLWLVDLLAKTTNLTAAFKLVDISGIHLEAGSDLQWRQAAGPPPVRPFAGPSEPQPTPDRGDERHEPAIERPSPTPRSAPGRSAQQKEAEQPPPRSHDSRSAGARDRLAAERDQIWSVLWTAAEELRPTEIRARLDRQGLSLDAWTVCNRLKELLAAGRVTARKELHAFQNPTYYRAVPPGGGAEETPSPPHRPPGGRLPAGRDRPLPAPRPLPSGLTAVHPDHPLARVIAWTHGKTMLFFGGKPSGGVTKHRRTMEIEATLRLKKLLWPEMEPGEQVGARLKELATSQADFVVLTQFGRHHMRQVALEAAELGLPVFYLRRSTGLAQIVHALKEQIERQKLLIPDLRVAA